MQANMPGPGHDIEDKKVIMQHSITYQSVLFNGSKLCWPVITKEVYAVYIQVKILAYYLEDVDFTLKIDHLPLKKILEKIYCKPKVNNRAVKISHLNILSVLKIL